LGGSAHEGVPGVGVAEVVDVRVKKDLVRAHVVALKDCCESVVLLVEVLVVTVGVDRSSRGRVSAMTPAVDARGVRARGRTRPRRMRCLATCVTATRASVVANQRVTSVGEREITWGIRTREPDDLVLHLVDREGVTVVDVGEKLFVHLLVAGDFRKVKAHESDEDVDVLDSNGLHVAELRSRGVDRGDVVMESFLKQRHVLRPRARSLCVIDAPVPGYKRKISVHVDVPLSGESTLTFADTL
jgi:hypothetical protein